MTCKDHGATHDDLKHRVKQNVDCVGMREEERQLAHDRRRVQGARFDEHNHDRPVLGSHSRERAGLGELSTHPPYSTSNEASNEQVGDQSENEKNLAPKLESRIEDPVYRAMELPCRVVAGSWCICWWIGERY